MTNPKTTADLIAWLRLGAESSANDAKHLQSVADSIPDEINSHEQYCAGEARENTDNFMQTADRLAEQQKVIDEQRQVIEHCRERADKGEHRSRGHICDATQECMSIKQKCEKALQHTAEVE